MKSAKLPDGRIQIPLTLSSHGIDADGVELIGPDDPRYSSHALTAVPVETLNAEEIRSRGLSIYLASA